MIELVPFQCKGDKCRVTWKAMVNSTQEYCSNCKPDRTKKWIAHDRELEAKKPTRYEKAKERFFKQHREIKEHVPEHSEVVTERTYGNRSARSWNQINLKKKYGKNPDVIKCGCGNFYMKRINQFGATKTLLVKQCPQCGESSDFQEQLANA